MQVKPRSPLSLRLQDLVFVVLFSVTIALLAWLSTRYAVQIDWTAGGRNTLSAASRELLQRLDGPVQITAFVRANPSLRKGVTTLVDRYRRYKSDMELLFVNPDADPERIRTLGIQSEGELYLEYRGRGERLQQLNEQGLTNALQRLQRHGERQVLFLTGHGERSPRGIANHDLGNFGRELERTGIAPHELNLAVDPQIGAATAVLVIASPQVALLAGEVNLILDFLDRGGNLLWLFDPNEATGLHGLAEALGIRVLPGVVVDAGASLFGVDNPAFVVVANYGQHPVVRSMHTLTLLPVAAALEAQPIAGWEPQELLVTQPRAWTEVGPLNGAIRFDPGSEERAGPLSVAIALSRPHPGTGSSRRQRVVIVGDGDFLSNAYLGNGGNLPLGLNILNWLSEDDSLIAIHTTAAPDRSLQFSEKALLIMGTGFLLVLPLGLLSSGWVLWWRRRRR